MEKPTAGKLHQGFPPVLPLLLFPLTATLIFYFPLLKNGFVNWDDPQVILNNIHIRALHLSNLRWMVTSFHTGNWMPLTWLTLAANYALGGADPWGYHLANLVLHLMNTGVVLLLTFRLCQAGRIERGRALSCASLAALIFGLHPIHVESVAWASERKDVLCALFYLLAIHAYLVAVFREKHKPKLATCFVFFVLALAAKPMAVTLPVVLLILDLWPLDRLGTSFRRALAEKALFFGVSLAGSATAVAAQATAKAISPSENWPFLLRVLNAFRSIIFYPWKMVWPQGLSPLYPVPPQITPSFYVEGILGIIVTCLVSLACFRYWKKAPFWSTAWGFYLVSLAPLLGFLQVGSQAAADRYTYLPGLGMILPTAVLLSSAFSRRPRLMIPFSILLALALGTATWNQLGLWKDSQSLWERVVTLYPGQSTVAHTNLGSYYEKAGRLEEALDQYKRAAAIPPPSAVTHNGMGAVYFLQGRTEQAISEFRYATALDPHYTAPHRNLWYLYQNSGHPGEALAEILAAVDLDPESPDLNRCLGEAYEKTGQDQMARRYYAKAQELSAGGTD